MGDVEYGEASCREESSDLSAPGAVRSDLSRPGTVLGPAWSAGAGRDGCGGSGHGPLQGSGLPLDRPGDGRTDLPGRGRGGEPADLLRGDGLGRRVAVAGRRPDLEVCHGPGTVLERRV